MTDQTFPLIRLFQACLADPQRFDALMYLGLALTHARQRNQPEILKNFEPEEVRKAFNDHAAGSNFKPGESLLEGFVLKEVMACGDTRLRSGVDDAWICSMKGRDQHYAFMNALAIGSRLQ